MNISSLIKVFGIAVAGFVPQAQANPFGISFVKVNPPKDKKEEAICFRLKLSQTDVFSEHNFTDITFRPDTTVFLQKNMVIDDEEEILKKTFKNFNCEKDPFEIPEKYLPLEDKNRAECVDKDGKPLKFLVVARIYEQYDWRYGGAFLCISGHPKQRVFYITDKILFLDGIDFIVSESVPYISENAATKIRKVGLSTSSRVQCVFPVRYSVDNTDSSCRSIFRMADQRKFEAKHMPTGSFFMGDMGCSTSIRCPFFVVKNFSIFSSKGPQGFLPQQGFSGDCVVIILAEKDDWEEGIKMNFGFNDKLYGEGSEIRIYGHIIYCKAFHDIVLDANKVIGGEPWNGKSDFYFPNAVIFFFFFPKEQEQPNK